ncbi:metallophosphoesterase [Paenibacillus sp. L3-i20]|uniref:metallophosphoesterase n=1 Tax=Paenibacillus sp. L3-i20 TaxID=2905833 RepID=UPI001EDCE639|nr:metallophosphoesterase [Paenibacillus sp. L3-i20]GKU77260.1 hypothetical protein L3i20_v216570 [Paenibacillus sp. L3-i20]
MGNLGVLHLSDLHISSSEDPSASRLRESLIDDIKRVSENRNIKINAIAMTGDVVDKGGDDRAFEIAKDFFNELSEKCEIRKDNIIFVPGNHDVPRREAIEHLITNSKADSFNDENKLTEYWETIYPRFKKFNKFVCEVTGRSDFVEEDFGSGAVLIKTPNGVIKFLLINSSWSTLGEKDFGSLMINRWQLERLKNNILITEKADLTLTLMHHPLDWFSATERKVLIEYLTDKRCIPTEVILHGHIHDGKIEYFGNADKNIMSLVTGIGYPEKTNYGLGRLKNGSCRYAIYNFNTEICKLSTCLRISRDNGDFVADTLLYKVAGESGYFERQYKVPLIIETAKAIDTNQSEIDISSVVEIIDTKLINTDNLGQLDKTINQQLIEIKENLIQTSTTLEIVDREIKTLEKPLISIAVLITTPLDREIIYSFENIIKNFVKYKVQINCYHFSIDTLRDLKGFDYIFVFTQVIKDKLIIEDEYFKSKLITLQEIEENLMSEHLKGFFIFIDKESNLDTQNVSIPLGIIWGDDLSSFIFKLFQKESLKSISQSIILNNEKFTLIPFEKGSSKVTMLYDHSRLKLSENIDVKNLINFVGRRTDLEDITRKIINNNNQILTIKGSGGIGKTSIVKKIAIEFFERGYYHDGIFFIDCEFIHNYQSFEYKIAQCFDIDSSINLREHIVQNNMKIDGLIMLDNFEPLLYIEDVELIKNLLTFICEYSSMVITSREWVNLEFEERHELRALTNEEALQLFNKYYKSNISDKDTRILKEDILGKLLNNNPLAIKIITRNIPKSKNMELLRNELEVDFFSITAEGYDDIFEEKADTNIERSKSLYQSISYSYKRLLPNEKLLFEILSFFPDGIHMNNIKTFFLQGNNKWGAMRITDREINSLENKSLIEINKGFIELQSIIGRFAGHQFPKRTNEDKVGFYKKVFEFIYYVVHKVETVYTQNTAQGLYVFDQNVENCLKCLDYITLFDKDKNEKLILISYLDILFRALEQSMRFYMKLPDIKEHFNDIEKADLMLDIIIIKSKYYEGNFEEAYVQLQKLLPIESMYSLDSSDIVQKYILHSAISVYRYRNTSDIRRFFIESNFISYAGLEGILFDAGEYKKYIDLVAGKREIDFYYFEVKYNTNSLDKEMLEEYIGSLYKKQYAEIMQTNYIKAKQYGLDKKTVNKLVVTSSYTSGLKLLMLGFIESDIEKKRTYYEAAINDLQPIRYYYTEAIYFYAKYLVSQNFEDKNVWIEKGLLLSHENHYRLLTHKFDCLISGIEEVYDESKYELPHDLLIDKVIYKYKKAENY